MTLTEWARSPGIHPQAAYQWFGNETLPVPAVRVAVEVGSGLTGSRSKLRRLLVEALMSRCAQHYVGPPALSRPAAMMAT